MGAEEGRGWVADGIGVRIREVAGNRPPLVGCRREKIAVPGIALLIQQPLKYIHSSAHTRGTRMYTGETEASYSDLYSISSSSAMGFWKQNDSVCNRDPRKKKSTGETKTNILRTSGKRATRNVGKKKNGKGPGGKAMGKRGEWNEKEKRFYAYIYIYMRLV